MPLLRYFLCVGAALFTLLLAVNAVLPSPPSGDGVNSSSELPVIRIHSDRKGPEAVVFDTNRPSVAPAAVAKTETAALAPSAVAEIAPKARVREAFAQFVPPETKAPSATESKKVESRPRPKRKVARVRANRPMVVAQQPPHFGLFTW